MRHLIYVFLLLFSLPALSQIRPDQFPEKETATGTDEIYTQSGGVAYRIVFDTAKTFFAPDIDQVALAYSIDSTGTNIVDSLRGRFVLDAGGNWWYVDYDKTAVSIGTAGAGGGSGETNTMDNVGDGTGIYYQKDGVQFQLKSLKAGGIASLSNTDTTITITATEVDGSIANELDTITIAGDSGSVDISDAETLTIAGAGIATTAVSGNTLTVTATEVDGSTTNELGTVSSITAVPDTSGLSPVQGDAFINATADTLGLYSGAAWVLFYGGGGATDTDWSISGDTLISGEPNVNIGAANMPTPGTIFNLQDEMAIFKDGFSASTNFFFGDIAGWSTAAGGAAYNLSNNFHAWWDDVDDIRIEYENNAGPMQFYIEGIGEAWHGWQNGATHLWSLGYDTSTDFGQALTLNNGFGIDNTPYFVASTTGEIMIPGNFQIADTIAISGTVYPFEVRKNTSGLLGRFFNTNPSGRGLLIRGGGLDQSTQNEDLLKVQNNADSVPVFQVHPNGQVVINSLPTIIIPDTLAALDIRAVDKGVLFPRLTEAERGAISSPPTSLMVYNTDSDHIQHYDNSEWVSHSVVPPVSAPTVSVATSINLKNWDRGIINLDFSGISDAVTIVPSNPFNGGEYVFWVEGCSNDTITFPNNFLSRDRDSLKTRLCTTNEIIEFFYDGTNYITTDTIWAPVTAIGGDVTPPSLSSAFTQSGQDSVIVLDYNEALDETSIPATGDFSLSGGVSISSVSVSNDSIFIYSATPYTCDSTITISYTAGVNPIQDLSGNSAANLTNQAVTNNIAGCGGGGDSLLNEYTGAIAAYSLQVINSARVDSNVVLVRRSSDNAELSFTAAEITDGTLTTWTGANDGYVVTMYDHTGNGNHLTQDTASLQPLIVFSGSVITRNTMPALRMNASKLRTNRLISGTSWSVFSVGAFDDVSVDGTAETLCAQHSGPADPGRTVFIQLRRITSDNGFATFFNNGTSYTGRHSATPTTDQKILSSISDGVNVDFSVNGSLEEVITGQSVTPMNNNFTIGAYSSNTGEMTGYIQELVIYSNDQGANRIGIESNMNDRYGTY